LYTIRVITQTRSVILSLSHLRSLAFWLSGFLAFSFFIVGCGTSNSKLIQKYNDFAIKSGKAGLWREAMFRWQRVIEIDPKNAKAHNNLGVAYEALERFDEALAEYDEAISAEPDNEIYHENRLKCKLNQERGLKKPSKKKGAARKKKAVHRERGKTI